MANDISIITGIIVIFIIVGTFLPVLNVGFGVTDTSISDVDDLASSLGNATKSMGDKSGLIATVGSLSIFDVIKSIAKVFIWIFPTGIIIIDLIFIVLKIILIITIARNLWVGGGS